MARRNVNLQAVGLVYQPYVEATRVLATRVQEFLAQRGSEGRILSAFALSEQQVRGLGLAITFGGDGTVLRAARWLATCHVPILPVRMGTLSFLGEVSPQELPERLEPYLAGDCWLDQRAMLCAEVRGFRTLALNDLVIGRGASARAVKLDVWVEEAYLTRYVADGLVLATATGSTAYALAAGGPVLAPELADILLQPVAPHLAALRSLVVPGSATVRVAIRTRQPGVLTVDGQLDYPFEDGQEVRVAIAAERALFARRGKKADFYATLVSKLVR
ncbi:MAG: NAD(+)/NADH kinase [Chloroflexi bacterium]|nr:NAD(+)/NADH kinase [Chloroflexota bacterium]